MAEDLAVLDRVRKSGQSLALSDDDVMNAIGSAILHPLAQGQVLLGLNSGPSSMGRDGRSTPLRYRQPTGASGPATQGDHADAHAKPLAIRLQQAGSADEAGHLIGDAIARTLADIFMIPAAEIDLAKPLALYGVDSLVAVELRNMLMLQAAADVSIFTILQSVSLTALAGDTVAKSICRGGHGRSSRSACYQNDLLKVCNFISSAGWSVTGAFLFVIR